jgi:gluconolactonase
MMKRKWPILVLLAAASGAALALACSDTGPDAGPRTNGCIADGCFDGSVVTDTGAPGPGVDAGPQNDGAPFVYPNPLEGTSKTATLVKDGFQFTEGPVWIQGHLLFSDVSQNTIFELGADGTTTTAFRTNTGGANGNAVDSQGRLVTCEGGNRRIVRSSGMKGAAVNTIGPTSFMGRPFNAPNDVIVRADGNIYFTDPDYGADPDAGARQPKQAVFRLAPNGGNLNLSRVKEYDTNPNGVGLSPDGKKLYVVDTTANVVNVWDLAADGTPSNERKFGNVNGGDGMAVDDAGNVYATSADGVVVFDKNGGALGTITVAEVPSNCTFGGADRKTLYITAHTGLYSIKLNVPGLP